MFEGLPESERKRRTAAMIIDLVGAYRAHYKSLIVVLASALVVSSLVVINSVYLIVSSSISLQDAFLSWTIGASVLLIASVLYVETHRKWGRKLLRLESDQERFRWFLGGSVET